MKENHTLQAEETELTQLAVRSQTRKVAQIQPTKTLIFQT